MTGDLSQREIALLRAVRTHGHQGSWGVLNEFNRLIGSNVFSHKFWEDLHALEATGYIAPLAWTLTPSGLAEIERANAA